MESNDNHLGRRKIAKVLMIGGAVKAVTLPARWAKPLVATVLIPAHAVASTTTTTTTSTTTPPA